jgi:hypothetical protein
MMLLLGGFAVLTWFVQLEAVPLLPTTVKLQLYGPPPDGPPLLVLPPQLQTNSPTLTTHMRPTRRPERMSPSFIECNSGRDVKTTGRERRDPLTTREPRPQFAGVTT